MKVLVILCSHDMDPKYSDNIRILNELLQQEGRTVEYAGVSSSDDFSNYESIITFKYKMVNPKKQISKLFDFVTTHREHLDYEWYIKFRPEVTLLAPIDFTTLVDTAINARVRQYVGPKRVKYGASVGGEGGWSYIRDCHNYSDIEREVILDDHIVLIHNKLIKAGALQSVSSIDSMRNDEWLQTNIWRSKGFSLNVVGIHAKFCKYGDSISGDVNM